MPVPKVLKPVKDKLIMSSFDNCNANDTYPLLDCVWLITSSLLTVTIIFHGEYPPDPWIKATQSSVAV